MHDLVKTLSKEEWEWVAVSRKEVKAFRIEIPSKWSPLKDPRPEWRIKETQIKVSGDDAQKHTREEDFHPRKSSVPEVCIDELWSEGKVRMPSPAIAGRFDIQDVKVAAIETDHNDCKRDDKSSPKSDFIKTEHETKVLNQIEPDQNVSLPRDAKIAKTIRISAVDPQEPLLHFCSNLFIFVY